MNSHIDCEKCNHDKITRIMKELEDSGLTWDWKFTGETRKRWWFRGKIRIQQKQIKIAMPPDMFPHGVYQWKTIEIK